MVELEELLMMEMYLEVLDLLKEDQLEELQVQEDLEVEEEVHNMELKILLQLERVVETVKLNIDF
ncbi:MAG: hypothetical protein CMF74_13835 [Maricaulis sp.]|nr:hypothetical protein [Maricaulis sp.]